MRGAEVRILAGESVLLGADTMRRAVQGRPTHRPKTCVFGDAHTGANRRDVPLLDHGRRSGAARTERPLRLRRLNAPPQKTVSRFAATRVLLTGIHPGSTNLMDPKWLPIDLDQSAGDTTQNSILGGRCLRSPLSAPTATSTGRTRAPSPNMSVRRGTAAEWSSISAIWNSLARRGSWRCIESRSTARAQGSGGWWYLVVPSLGC